MKDNIYWLGRKLYALAVDLAEEENHIKIENTKNAEIFCKKIESIFEDYNLKVKE